VGGRREAVAQCMGPRPLHRPSTNEVPSPPSPVTLGRTWAGIHCDACWVSRVGVRLLPPRLVEKVVLDSADWTNRCDTMGPTCPSVARRAIGQHAPMHWQNTHSQPVRREGRLTIHSSGNAFSRAIVEAIEHCLRSCCVDARRGKRGAYTLSLPTRVRNHAHAYIGAPPWFGLNPVCWRRAAATHLRKRRVGV